jgi:ubiquinone/menaquinone biosynthesis C-methylase UbiE
MVEEARLLNKIFVASQRAEFLLADADRLPFKSETFDKVFTVNTIYFWDDPGKTLSEIARVLKPEGWIVVAVRPDSVMSHYPFARFGFRLFSSDDLKTLLTENNFYLRNIIERKEPNQEINGMKIPVETLIAIGSKS